MEKKYYLDTSIWLDFLEDRNEPDFPKSDWAKKLVERILIEKGIIIVSEAVKNELVGLGYSKYEIEIMFRPFQSIIQEVYTDKKQYGKAKDLKNKRKIPFLDALHAILSRDNKAIMVTRDLHFKKILDIARYKKPEDLI